MLFLLNGLPVVVFVSSWPWISKYALVLVKLNLMKHHFITAKGKAISDKGIFAAASSIIQLFFIAGHWLGILHALYYSVANVNVKRLKCNGTLLWTTGGHVCVHTSNFHEEKLHKHGLGPSSSSHAIKHITSLKRKELSYLSSCLTMELIACSLLVTLIYNLSGTGF